MKYAVKSEYFCTISLNEAPKIIKNVHLLSQTGQIQMVNMGSPMEASEAQVKHHEIIKNVHFLSQIDQNQMVNLGAWQGSQPAKTRRAAIYFLLDH